MPKMSALTGYYGGKAGPCGAWIAAQLPAHRVYVEPFGGMAGVLMQKQPSLVEVYNDLAGELVNLFRVVRERPADLVAALELTPYARAEYGNCRAARRLPADEVERARQTYVILTQSRDNSLLGKGFSHGGAAYTGSVADTFRAGLTRIPAVCERLRGVVIENRCALDLLRQWDGPDTLFYLDPPYTLAQRTAKAGYVHEMDDEAHTALLDRLPGLKAAVLLSGYRNPLYTARLEATGWLRRDFATVAHSSARRPGKRSNGAARVESLWLNPQAAAATPTLFD